MSREPDADGEGGPDTGDSAPEDAAGPDNAVGPENAAVPDEFDAIVSGWHSEGQVPQWPDDGPDLPRADLPATGLPMSGHPTTDLPTTELPTTDPEVTDPPNAPPMSPTVPPTVFAPPPVVRPYAELPEDHFVPPEPPPLTRPGPPVLVGLGMLVLGLILLVTPGWIGVSAIYGLPLGLVGLASGLGWLVLRLWPDSRSGDGSRDDGDGAVL